MRRTATRTLAWTLIMILLTSCLSLGALAEAATEATVPTARDDFYDYINGAWLATAAIPADQYSTGGFNDLAYDILDLLRADSDKMISGEIQPDTDLMKQYAAFYAMCADYETRNADGIEPLEPLLARVEAVENLDVLSDADWLLSGMPTPFTLNVETDMGDAQQYALYAYAPSLLLPDVSYYDEANPYKAMLLGAMKNVATQLLTMAGYTEEDAAHIADEAIAFDALLAPLARTAEENSDFKTMYNPEGTAAFFAAHKNVDFQSLVSDLVKEVPAQLINVDPRYFAAFDEIVCEENFPLIKSWMLYQTAMSCGNYLSEDIQVLASSVGNMLLGQAEPTSKERLAYALASSIYGHVVGDYYGRTYFGEEAKADVVRMVQKMIEVYAQRLKANTWLSDATREAALRKLNAISIQVGYPDTINPVFEKLIVTPESDGGTLLSNAMDFARIFQEDRFAKLGTPVDRSRWSLTAATVNAMYNPQTNAIMFPAAILQAPFYALEQSASANYGGIGAVIAHEISHAFDPNGALFDEYGSMANWWTDEDMAHFEKLAQDMVTLFDGVEYAGVPVNGNLTKTENVADAGGVRCALEVVKSLDDPDLEAFFTNWALVWRVKYTPEIEQYLLATDVHAPNKLRVNMQLPLLSEFYETYGVQEGDGMYIAPERRVSIW